jgi:hypothetical protein
MESVVRVLRASATIEEGSADKPDTEKRGEEETKDHALCLQPG